VKIKLSYSHGTDVTLPAMIARAEDCGCGRPCVTAAMITAEDACEECMREIAADLASQLVTRHGIAKVAGMTSYRDGADLIIEVWGE